jgi:hypothetical protein
LRIHLLGNQADEQRSGWEFGLCFGVVLGVYFQLAPAGPGEGGVFLNFSINKALPGTTYSNGDKYGRRIFGCGKGLSDRRER